MAENKNYVGRVTRTRFEISIQWLFNQYTIDTFWKNVADIFDNNLRPEAIASIAWTQVRLWVQTKEEDGPG